MNQSKGSLPWHKLPYGELAQTRHSEFVLRLPPVANSRGQPRTGHRQYVGFMNDSGTVLNEWRVGAYYGGGYDTILIIHVELPIIMPWTLHLRHGLARCWSRLASAVTSFTKNQAPQSNDRLPPSRG